jgi:DNA-nicking Smr family endonuclease
MSGRKPGDRLPDEDDVRALFRAAVGDATPLSTDRVHHEPPPPPAIPRQRHRDEQAALVESIEAPDLLDLHLEGGDEAAWLRPGMSPNVLRDLRRGRWVVQAHLDLHGMNRDEARHHVGLFLRECLAHGHRCVRVVHGKGLGSPGREPVLKRLVLGWLSQSEAVLAFCHARPSDGGSGAVVVLLSPPRPAAASRKT